MDCSAVVLMKGSSTLKVAPLPNPGLSAQILPPWASINPLAMERPMPIPPYLRVVCGSIWLELGKIFFNSLWGMPIPLSCTQLNFAAGLRGGSQGDLAVFRG